MKVLVWLFIHYDGTGRNLSKVEGNIWEIIVGQIFIDFMVSHNFPSSQISSLRWKFERKHIEWTENNNVSNILL